MFKSGENILINKERYQSTNVKLLNEIKSQVMNFGDPDLLNEFVYHNYPTAVSYFDDDMEKTALYLDMLSRNENTSQYIKRTQNYELYSSQYLPLYAFRKYCSGSRALNGRFEYPKDIRSMYYE